MSGRCTGYSSWILEGWYTNCRWAWFNSGDAPALYQQASIYWLHLSWLKTSMNKAGWQKHLISCDWSVFNSISSLKYQIQCLNLDLEEAVSQHVHVKIFKQSNKFQHPWFTREIDQQVKEREEDIASLNIQDCALTCSSFEMHVTRHSAQLKMLSCYVKMKGWDAYMVQEKFRKIR